MEIFAQMKEMHILVTSCFHNFPPGMALIHLPPRNNAHQSQMPVKNLSLCQKINLRALRWVAVGETNHSPAVIKQLCVKTFCMDNSYLYPRQQQHCPKQPWLNTQQPRTHYQKTFTIMQTNSLGFLLSPKLWLVQLLVFNGGFYIYNLKP